MFIQYIREFPSSNDSTYFSRHLSVTIQISLWKKSHFYTDVAYKYIYISHLLTVTKQNRGNLNYRFFSFSNNFQRVYVTRYDFNALHGWNAKEISSIRLKNERGRPEEREKTLFIVFERQQCVSPWQITIISPTCVIFTIRNLPFHACAAAYETYSPGKKEYHRGGTLPWLFDDAFDYA